MDKNKVRLMVDEKRFQKIYRNNILQFCEIWFPKESKMALYI